MSGNINRRLDGQRHAMQRPKFISAQNRLLRSAPENRLLRCIDKRSAWASSMRSVSCATHRRNAFGDCARFRRSIAIKCEPQRAPPTGETALRTDRVGRNFPAQEVKKMTRLAYDVHRSSEQSPRRLDLDRMHHIRSEDRRPRLRVARTATILSCRGDLAGPGRTHHPSSTVELFSE